jgi:hypothetical protein
VVNESVWLESKQHLITPSSVVVGGGLVSQPMLW